MCIVDSRDQVLWRKIVGLVLVLWSGGVHEGARGHDAGHLSLLV